MPIAIGAFFAIDAIIIAFVLTLWVFATIVMLKPIVQFLANAAGDIPVIGGWLADELNSIESYVSRWIQGLVNDAYRAGAQPFIEMMNTYAHAKSGELYSQSIVNGALYNAIAYAAAHAVGTVNQPTQTYVTNSSTANNTYITNNYQADLTQAYEYTGTSYQELAGWANTAVQSIYHDVVDVDGRIATLANDTATKLTQEHDYATVTANQAASAALISANDEIERRTAEAENYTKAVADYASQNFAYEHEWTDTTITQRVGDAANALDVKIAIAATVAAAAETAFADFMNDCGTDLCGGLSKLAKAFGETKDLLGTALLLGFLEEAIREPERTADATVAVADAVLSPARAIISDVFGG